MKKIILMLLVMFSFILVNAEETVEVRLQWVPNVYYNYEKNGLNYWGQFAYIYAGDKIAYCLDISKTINSTIYTKSNETQNNNLVTLSGYFGYGYDGNISLEDYMATQKMIWEYLDADKKIYFTTQSNGKGQKIDVSSIEDRIRYKINNYALFPSYDKDFKFTIGSTNNLIQNNKANNVYNIINNTNNIIEFTTDGLLFNANDVGNNFFYLETKYTKNFDNAIYVADDSQKIMVIGGINNIRRKYSYEVIGGSIKIKVIFDKIIDDMSFDQNIFEIYDENEELIGTYRPDNEGNILLEDLNLGKYKIKQINVQEGYKNKQDEYLVEITEENLNETLEINLYLKTINVTINKTYSNPLINKLYYDDGIVYKIYDLEDKFIKEVITDENGKITFNLDYGNYKVIQSNINNVNIYHDDILINKNMFEEDKIFNIHDDKYNAKIKVIILDKETNIPISNLIIAINEKEHITNDEGIFITEALDFGTYKFSNIKLDEYEELESFEYILNENSNFYIKNDEAYVDIILYLKKLEDVIIEIPEDNTDQEEPDNSIDQEKEDISKDDVEDSEEPEEKDESEELNQDDNKDSIIETPEEDNTNQDESENDEESNSDLNKDEEIEDNIVVPKDDTSDYDDINKEDSIKDEALQNKDNEDAISKDEDNNIKVDKLPFLGENKNESSKNYSFIDYLFKFIWMFI